MEVRVTFEAGGLARTVTGLRRVRAPVDEAGLDGEAEQALLTAARAEAPVRSGRLQRSLVVREDGLWGLAYGQFVARGTRPHVIVPQHSAWLVFRKDGRLVFARRVRHPGSRPNDFLGRAVERARPALRAVLVEVGRRLVDAMG